MRSTIEALAVGGRVKITANNGATGYVKRVERTDYALFDDMNGERSNWGNLQEITADAEYFVEHGALRPAISSRW